MDRRDQFWDNVSAKSLFQKVAWRVGWRGFVSIGAERPYGS